MYSDATTSASNRSLKYAALLTPALLLILLAGAVLFFKERMLYIDAPHILFRLINDGHFWIEQDRYGSFISQLLPLAGARLHMPLLWLMLLYSASFYLFFLTVSLVLVFSYRNYGLAILMGLYFTLFISDTYYWPNNEVHQGIAWMFLAFAANFFAASKKRNTLLLTVLFTVSFFLCIWTHPLVMLAAVYLWFFFMVDKNTWPYTKTQSIVLSVILLVLSYIKFYQGQHNWYDGGKLEMVTQFQFSKIKTVLHSPQLRFFIHSCLYQYRIFSLLFITGLAGLLLNKKYLLFVWTLIFVCGYLLLTSITFWDVSLRSYLESEYAPLVIICAAPFVYYVLPKIKAGYSVALFTAIFLLRIACIYNASAPFTERVAIMQGIGDKMKERHLTKVIITEPSPGIDSALIMNWAAPVESIYISQLKGEIPQRTFIFLDPTQIKAADTTVKNLLLGAFEKRPASRLNAYYFQMDTATTYRVFSYTTLME